MSRSGLIWLFAALSALNFSAASADPALLGRLAPNVGAPEVPRPGGPGAIVGLRLQGMAGQAGRISCFGHVFREGGWPQGTDLAAISSARSLPLQTDIKARHADGSVRHAILCMQLPKTNRDAFIELRQSEPVAAATPLDVGAVLRRGFDMTLSFDFGGPTVTLDVAELLSQDLERSNDNWLSGALASEVRITRRLTPQLTAIFDVRALADGAVRTAVSVHNDAMYETKNTDLDYTYRIGMGGQTLVERQVSHRRHANWREVVWAGAQPASAHIVYDYPYMIAAGAVPAYDPTLELSEAFLKGLRDAHAEADTAPLASALIEKAMPTTGGRFDIGMVPAWTLAWLRTQSPLYRQIMMETAEAAGSVPWHLRDSKTRIVPTLDDHPRYWMDQRASLARHGHGPIETSVDGWKLDNAHQPDLSYVPYLITGDRYFLDELHAQQAFSLFSYNPDYRGDADGNLSNEQVRAQAWANRTHANAAFITPDDHPLKSYLVAKQDQRLNWYPGEYRDNDSRGGARANATFGWIQGPQPKGEYRGWQIDYFSMALAQARRFGSDGALSTYHGLIRQFQLNRFLHHEMNPDWGTAYYMMLGERGSGAPYARWSEVATATAQTGKVKEGVLASSEAAWAYAAQARAGYAMLTSSFDDPLAADVYAFLAGETAHFNNPGDMGWTRYPTWGIVPVFADGTTLDLGRHYQGDAGNNRFAGTDANELFAAKEGNDVLLGGGGNDILAGWSGDDILDGGEGENFIAGGRGSDRLFLYGDLNFASGGPGNDIFVIAEDARGAEQPTGRVEIFDFEPERDTIVISGERFDSAAIRQFGVAAQGGTLIELRDGGSVLFRHGKGPNSAGG